MQKVLIIKSSLMAEASNSSALADDFKAMLAERDPKVEILELDLNQHRLPLLDAEMVAAMYADTPDEGQRQRLAESDALIEQLFAVDTVVLATPMYNFAIPSTLKNYFDLVARVGKTFSYEADGPQGKLTHLKGVVIVASGGDYTQPPYDAYDQVTPYLKTILGFIGVEQLEFVYASNMAQQGEAQQQSLQQARTQLQALLDKTTDDQ